MTRVESQVTRQALLVVGDTMETDPPPEKLELFTEDGLAVDVGKDRTRARWRGEWVPVPTAPYEQNDFVMHDDKLYILSDIDLYDGTSAPPAAGWAIMTISAGMQFFGEWAPGGYKKQSVVTRDNKLWASNVEIVDAEFEFVDSAWDSQYGGSETISIPVPDATLVGDIMIWAGHQGHYAKRSRPADYLDWELLSSDGINNDGFPPGHTELYAKVATEDDLGTNKVCTENVGENGTCQLLVFRNSGMPVAAEVDLQKSQVDSLPTTLTVTPGTDPAETQAGDTVVRIFIATAQNFAIDSGNHPVFSAGSDSQDELVFDIHQIFGAGSYWADAGASSLSSFSWTSGEHKYAIRYSVRLPSPTGFNLDQWTQIGLIAAAGIEGSLPSGGSTGEILAKDTSDDYDVGWIAPPSDLPVGGASGYLLAKASGADGDVTWVAAPGPGSGLIPVGGLTGQALKKSSGSDYATAWATTHEVPAGGSSGDFLSKSSGSDYALAWATPTAGGGYKGDWAIGTTYPAGSVVRYNGELWGTLSSIITVAPDAVAGSNIGSAVRGIQGKDIDRLDDGVLYTKTFTVDTPLSSGGLRSIPLMVDFVGSNANMTLTFANRADSTIKLWVDANAGAVDGIGDLVQGSSGSRTIRWGTFFGGSDPHMLLLEGNDTDILGEVDVTISGADTVAPPSFTPNPWLRLTYHTRPIISALPSSPFDGQVIAYQNAAMATLGVVWELRYRAAASGSYKWEFMGGGSLYLYDSAQYNATQSSYGYAGTGQLVVPLAGDYEVSMSAGITTDNATANTEVWCGIGVGGSVSAAAEVNKFMQSSPQYAITYHAFSGRVLTGLAAAAVVRPMFKSSTGLAYIEKPRITMRPVRVG